MHSHTIDAAQQGFFKACKTTRALRKAGLTESKFPWRNKKYRTTIWKNTSIRFKNNKLELSMGVHNPKVLITLPVEMFNVVRFLEVRLVFDKKSRHYTWHIVAENGKQAKPALGINIVSVDLGEIHPAVVGDHQESTIITCRERRHEVQGHAKRLASIAKSLSKKKKMSRRYRKLVRTKSKMKAKHECVTRDMEHKISRAIVNVAIECQSSTIVIGDIRDIADGVALGKQTNQKISSWNHGQVQKYVKYKAESEGITVKLVNERYSSQTCLSCGNRHKPKGRNYDCPACGFRCHRDVVGQINILSIFRYGEPGKIPAPQRVKHRMPHNLRLMRRCPDTGQIFLQNKSVA